MSKRYDNSSSPRLIREKCMRVVNCTYDYYHKHGKWPSTGDLAANYLGVRSNRYTESSSTWWWHWRNEAIARGLLTEGQGVTDKNIKKIIARKLNHPRLGW